MRAYGISHIGKVRESNQDAFFVQTDPIGSLSNLYIVADGMGGHLAGEIASTSSITAFSEFVKTHIFPQENLLDFLVEATQFANFVVYKKSQENKNYRGMGTTFISMSIQNNKVYASHIGDSRIYKIDEHSITQITQDHSYVEEMLRRGEISKEQAVNHPNKNVLTRALGDENLANVDAIVFDVKKGDKILMCTDGLTNMVLDRDIKDIITENSIEVAANNLVVRANANGGKDNITCLLVEIDTGAIAAVTGDSDAS